MPIYRPTELRQFLDQLQVGPKKRLSQNFLIDGNIIRKIVETANVQPGDLVLEIGPGPGALTEALLERGAHVIAVEKDEVLAKALERLKTEDKHLEVFCEDIMNFPIEEKCLAFLKKGQKAKVIANLPYHLTTPILASLITHCDIFSTLCLMVQEEVARRFTALPSTSDYSAFTVFLNFYSTPHYAFTVSPRCFYPAPKVHSAVVQFVLKKAPTVSNQESFFRLTRTAFAHRRKMLRSSLRELHSTEQITEALLAIGLSALARPENLSLQEWLALFEQLRLQDSSASHH